MALVTVILWSGCVIISGGWCIKYYKKPTWST